MQRGTPILWDIYEEHLDEAAFLRSQWERSLHSANHTIGEVATGPEERLAAHLDALVIGGRPVAERLLLPALEGDADHAFVAAWALLQAEDADWLEAVWTALLAAPGARDAPDASEAPARGEAPDASEAPDEPAGGPRAGIARAFELATRADLPARLGPRLRQHAPHADAVIVDVLAARDPARLARMPWRELALIAAEGSAALLVALLRALQRVPSSAPLALIEAHLSSSHPGVRAAAIEAGALLRLPSTRAACRQTIAERGPHVRQALAALIALGDGSDHERLRRWSETADLARDVLWALGSSGRIDVIGTLLQALDDPSLAPVAADSLSAITGLDIEGSFTSAGSPASLDDTIDDDAPPPEPCPDDDLPLPHSENVRAWWRANAQRFDPSQRYVRGLPWTSATLVSELERCATWRRPALRLALGATPGSTLDLRTWAHQQLGWSPSGERAPVALATTP